MALIRKNNGTTGLDPFFSWPKDFDSFFTNALENMGYDREFMTKKLEGFSPSMDVSETDNEYKVKMEIPGMSEEDLDLTFQDNTLVVRGEKKSEEQEDKENFHMKETRYGHFMRTLPFAANVDEDKITAEFKNGVLKVNLGKSQDTIDKTRKIKIN